MKLTINKYLNARIAKPSLDAVCNFFRNPGETIEIDDLLIGDEIEGNCIWYHCKEDGCYYWSGGIEEIEFVLGENTSIHKRERDLLKVYNDLIKFHFSDYKKKYANLTGIHIGDKKVGKDILTGNYLVFQVLKKEDDISESSKIPSIINFKGISIDTDIVEASKAEFQWAYGGYDAHRRAGGSISRFSSEIGGTMSFKCETLDPPKMYFVVTNFHVIGEDLISTGNYSYDNPRSTDMEVVLPAWDYSPDARNLKGYLVKALFGIYQDTALIQLIDGGFATNILPDDSAISGSIDVFNVNSYRGSAIVMFGAMTGRKEGIISSVNAAKEFSLGEGGLENPMIELIQFGRISNPGDSGSPILLGSEIIGILIGADDYNSYAIPIQRILDFYNVKISLP